MSNRRRALLAATTGSLPSAYQQVEYLESTGTQYIDTGVTPSDLIGFDIHYLMTVGGSNIEQIVIGSSYWGRYRYFLDMNFSGQKRQVQFGVAGGYFGVYYQADINKSYQFITNVSGNDFGNYELYENGQLVSAGVASGDISTNINNIYLFCRNNDNVATFNAYMRLFSCKIYSNGTIIRDFIPCYRRSDNEPGLYDIINRTFYTNAGTGTFIVGNNIK